MLELIGDKEGLFSKPEFRRRAALDKEQCTTSCGRNYTLKGRKVRQKRQSVFWQEDERTPNEDFLFPENKKLTSAEREVENQKI